MMRHRHDLRYAALLVVSSNLGCGPTDHVLGLLPGTARGGAASRLNDGNDGAAGTAGERTAGGGSSTGGTPSFGGEAGETRDGVGGSDTTRTNGGTSGAGGSHVVKPSTDAGDAAWATKGAQGGAAGQAGESAAGEPSSQVSFGSVDVMTLTDFPDVGETETDLIAAFSVQYFPASCPVTQFGSCELYLCDMTPYFYGGPDAGEISFQSQGFFEQIRPDEYGGYSVYSSSFAFNGGESIAITAAGDAVPAFQDQIQFPKPLVLTAPTPSRYADDGTIYISPHEDLTLTWDGGVPGVTLALDAYALSPPYLACGVPSEQGTLTIPASILEQLPLGKLNINTDVFHTIDRGRFQVTVAAEAGVLTASKAHRVTLELD